MKEKELQEKKALEIAREFGNGWKKEACGGSAVQAERTALLHRRIYDQ